MQTGDLDQRIEFLRPVVTGQDSMGADILGSPISLRAVWAQVKSLDGRELQANAQRWAEARYKITIRRQPGLELLETDFITWRSRQLDMLDIRGQGTRDDFWTIIAKDRK